MSLYNILINWILYPLTLILVPIIIYRILARPPMDFPKGIYLAPTDHWGIKLFGQMWVLIAEEGGAPQMRWMEAAQKEGKTNIGYDFTFSSRAVQVLHPADVQALLTGEHEYNLTKHSDYSRLADILGKFGIITIQDQKAHSEVRKLLAPGFQSRVLNAIANYVVPKHSLGLDKDLSEIAAKKDQNGACLGTAFDKFTLGVIVESAFKKLAVGGVDIGSQFTRVQNVVGLSPIDLLPRWFVKLLPLKRRRVVEDVQSKIRIVTNEMLKTVRAQYENDEIRPGQEVVIDFIAKEKAINEQMAADNLLTILFAGHETTSRALQWTTMYLAQNPKVQERLYEELCDAVALHTQPSLEDLKDCTYLEMVCKESLRLSPPAPIVARVALKDVTLPHSGVTLPEGIRVAFPIFCIHRNKEVYGEDAYEFRPERWEEARVKAQLERFPCAWMPFLPQKHHRNCIGSTFAWNELLIAVASMVRSFKLEWPEGQAQPRRRWVITMRPQPDPRIRVTSRDA